MDDTRTLTLRIGDKDNISITKLYEVLSNVQSAMFSIGDYLEGREPRTAGDFSKRVKETCELQISDIRKGSLKLALQVPPPTHTTKEAAQTNLGENAMDNFYQIFATLASKEYATKLPKIIRDTSSRRKILQRFEKIIPESDDPPLEIGAPGKAEIRLASTYRDRIREIMPSFEIPNSKKVTGRLMELRVDNKKGFQVDTYEGTIKGEYSPEAEEFFKLNIGKLVELEGRLKLKQSTSYLQIDKTSNCAKADKYPISEIKAGVFNKALAQPLKVDIVFEDNGYIFQEPSFGLLVAAKNFKEGVTGIQEQFSILWEEYVNVPEETLAPDAKEFKKRLIAITE